MSGHDLDYFPPPPAPAPDAPAPGRWARVRGWLRERLDLLYPVALVLMVLALVIWLALMLPVHSDQRAADQRAHAELIERLQAQARADGHAAGYAAGLAAAQAARADHAAGVNKMAPSARPAARASSRPTAPADHQEQALDMPPQRWGTTDLDRALAAWPAQPQ